MRSSAKWALVAIAVVSLSTAVTTPAKDNAGASDSKAPKFDVPIPVKHKAKGIVLPVFDDAGRLQMDFSIEVGDRVDEDHLGMKNVHVDTYDDKGNLDIMLDIPTCTMDLNTRVVTSNVPVTIRRSDFEIVGDTMRFDIPAKFGKMIGHVRMLIYNHAEVSPGTTPNE